MQSDVAIPNALASGTLQRLTVQLDNLIRRGDAGIVRRAAAVEAIPGHRGSEGHQPGATEALEKAILASGAQMCIIVLAISFSPFQNAARFGCPILRMAENFLCAVLPSSSYFSASKW